MPGRTPDGPALQRRRPVAQRPHQPVVDAREVLRHHQLGDLGRAVGRLVDHPVGAATPGPRGPPASTSAAGVFAMRPHASRTRHWRGVDPRLRAAVDASLTAGTTTSSPCTGSRHGPRHGLWSALGPAPAVALGGEDGGAGDGRRPGGPRGGGLRAVLGGRLVRRPLAGPARVRAPLRGRLVPPRRDGRAAGYAARGMVGRSARRQTSRSGTRRTTTSVCWCRACSTTTGSGCWPAGGTACSPAAPSRTDDSGDVGLSNVWGARRRRAPSTTRCWRRSRRCTPAGRSPATPPARTLTAMLARGFTALGPQRVWLR